MLILAYTLSLWEKFSITFATKFSILVQGYVLYRLPKELTMLLTLTFFPKKKRNGLTMLWTQTKNIKTIVIVIVILFLIKRNPKFITIQNPKRFESNDIFCEWNILIWPSYIMLLVFSYIKCSEALIINVPTQQF